VLCISFVKVIIKVENFLVYVMHYFILLLVLIMFDDDKLTCMNPLG
jgi:hypothetical protein